MPGALHRARRRASPPRPPAPDLWHSAPVLWWRRTLLFAVLLEVALILLLLPVGLLFVNPVMPEPGRTDYAIYDGAVLIAYLVVGYAFGRRLVRVIPVQRALHGALLGTFAAVLYFGLCTTAPGGIPG